MLSPDHLDCLLAVALNVVLVPLSESMAPQTYRPNPGQMLPLEANGSLVFVRDPQHDHEMVAQTIPGWLLLFMMGCTFAIIASLACGLPNAPGGKLAAPTCWLWAVGGTIIITNALKRYVGR